MSFLPLSSFSTEPKPLERWSSQNAREVVPEKRFMKSDPTSIMISGSFTWSFE